MMAIVYTTTDLDNLKVALLTGAQEVQIGERKIKYRSQAELLQMIKIVTAYIDGESTSTTSNLIQATYTKGES